MTRAVALALAAWLFCAGTVLAEDDASSPHHMTKSDGELNMEVWAPARL